MNDYLSCNLKPEYQNDFWLLAQAMEKCYDACFFLHDCSKCPFYDVFDIECRSKEHCKGYLVDNAIFIYVRNLREYCGFYPERPNKPDVCEYLLDGSCALDIGLDCPFGLTEICNELLSSS